MMAMSLLHVPKTGGVALATALGRHVVRMGHDMRLEDYPLWPPIISIVRDPVARWISAWDMTYQPNRNIPEYVRWPTANDAALDPEALAWLESYWGRAFWSQCYWLRDAVYTLSRCWYIAHTETLDEDFAIIRDAIGAMGCEMPARTSGRRNANQGVKSILTPVAETAIRAHYHDDYALLRGL